MDFSLNKAAHPLNSAALNAFYEHSPDCIKVMTVDGVITNLSPGGVIALELDNVRILEGASWPNLWPGSEKVRVQQAIEQARSGESTQFVAFCPTAKNTPRWWDVMVTPMFGQERKVEGILVVSRDVTELISIQEALVEADLRKTEFLTVLSHELRNPLSTLQMAANLIEKLQSASPKLADVSKMIARQVGHISRLAEDLLDVSRITRGQIGLSLEKCDIRTVIAAAEEQTHSALLSRGQTVHVDAPEKAVCVVGDAVRLTQIFTNLIGNASRYSPMDSVISIVINEHDNMATISVADIGQGISQELMPRLFDNYSQERTSDNRKGGVGLGLAIVKGLVAIHHGTVDAYSEGIGKGSTFIVTLPTH